jgi:hypothetical protein
MGNICRRWQLDEARYLERSWGIVPRTAIAHRLRRTEPAVERMAIRLGLSLKRDHYTARMVAAELGVAPHTVSVWIRSGLLQPAGRRAQCWLVPYEEIERFVKQRVRHPSPQTQWDWRRMPRGWWRSYAAEIAEETHD